MLDPTQEPEFYVSQSSEHYRPQNYRPEWEIHPSLSPWLAPGRNSKRARCTYCDIEMTADICVLKSHGKGARHRRRLMGETLTSNSRYNPSWERDPDYADWVRPGRVKTRAECRYCDVEFAAETTVLKNHAKSKRHGRAASQAKKLVEMSRVWGAEKLLVDGCSNEDPLEISKKFSAEDGRGSFTEAPTSETPDVCTLTVDEGSSSSDDSPPVGEGFDYEGRISTNSDTLHFELPHPAASEPKINLHEVTHENASLLDIDASPTVTENFGGSEATVRVRNAHILSLPNTLVMTIEDSNSSSINGTLDSCKSSEVKNDGDDIVDSPVLLQASCKLCQGQMYEDEDGRQLCVACKVAYTEHEASGSLYSWEAGRRDDEELHDTAAGGEGGGPYVVCSFVRPTGVRNAANACVVQGYDLSSEVRRLVEALRAQVSLLNLRLAGGSGQQDALLRLDKVLGLLDKIKRL